MSLRIYAGDSVHLMTPYTNDATLLQNPLRQPRLAQNTPGFGLHVTHNAEHSSKWGQLIENLPHEKPANQSPGLIAQLLHSAGARKMPAQEIDLYYQTNPEQHPDHPNQRAARNGLHLIYAGATAATLLSGYGLMRFLSAQPATLMRQSFGLAPSVLNGKVFQNLSKESALLLQVDRISKTRQQMQARIGQIDEQLEATRQSFFQYPGGSSWHKQLTQQQKSLQGERTLLTRDIEKLTDNAVKSANQQLEVIGSHYRVGADLSASALPAEVLKTRTDALLKKEFPDVWRAAQDGELMSMQLLKTREYTVGVTPQNARQKLEHAVDALVQARSTGDPQQIAPLLNAVKNLERYLESITPRSLF